LYSENIMKFHKRQGDRSGFFVKILIKLTLIVVLVFAVIIFIDKIDFPTPNKKIEKIISNENLKVVK